MKIFALITFAAFSSSAFADSSFIPAAGWEWFCTKEAKKENPNANLVCQMYALGVYENPAHGVCLPKNPGAKIAAIQMAARSVRGIIEERPEVGELPAAHVLANLQIMKDSYPCK